MIDLKAYGYTEIDQKYESLYVQDKTSYTIDRWARNKTIAMRGKQTMRNGGWKI